MSRHASSIDPRHRERTTSGFLLANSAVHTPTSARLPAIPSHSSGPATRGDTCRRISAAASYSEQTREVAFTEESNGRSSPMITCRDGPAPVGTRAVLRVGRRRARHRAATRAASGAIRPYRRTHRRRSSTTSLAVLFPAPAAARSRHRHVASGPRPVCSAGAMPPSAQTYCAGVTVDRR